MMPPMDALQQLLIHHHCRELVLRTAACADAHDAVGLAALFTTDAMLVRPDGATLQGRAAIEAAYRQRPAERITRHLVTNSLVDIESADAARVRSSVLLWSGNSTEPVGPQGRPAAARQLLGSFDDHCVQTPEGWRIARRHASFELHLGG
jgi:uncharacterized protein (TIGR02246 family)